jgi:hypothetical protein
MISSFNTSVQLAQKLQWTMDRVSYASRSIVPRQCTILTYQYLEQSITNFIRDHCPSDQGQISERDFSRFIYPSEIGKRSSQQIVNFANTIFGAFRVIRDLLLQIRSLDIRRVNSTESFVKKYIIFKRLLSILSLIRGRFATSDS